MNKCYLFKLILPYSRVSRNNSFTVILTKHNVIFSPQTLSSTFKYEHNSPEN